MGKRSNLIVGWMDDNNRLRCISGFLLLYGSLTGFGHFSALGAAIPETSSAGSILSSMMPKFARAADYPLVH
jgi:hypothetical protein